MKIALSGKMRAGKDFISDLIRLKYEMFERRAFADALKEDVEKIFGVTKENHPNGREILQLYGKVGRLAHPLFWVNKIIHDKNDFIIVTDLRFRNEADALKEAGFKLVRVHSSQESRTLRGELNHENDISETDLDDYEGFDYHLENDLDISISNIFEQITGMMEELGWEKEYLKLLDQAT